MKIKLPTLLLTMLAIAVQASAALLQPVILASKGEPSILMVGQSATVPVTIKQTVPAGSVITTGSNGRVAVALGEGQLVVLDSNTQLSIRSVQNDSGGAVVDLLYGTLRCSVDPERSGSGPAFTIMAGKESIQSKGTVWQTSKAADGTTTTVCLVSTVTVTIKGNLMIDVPAGSVLISTYANGVWTGSKVINLATGQTTTYSPDGAGGYTSAVSVSSITELGQARDAFQTALGQLTDMILNAQSAALNVVIGQINGVLSAAGLPTLTPPAGISNSAERDSIVSPEQP
ncbi:FecR family protein [Prosthecobacter fusiformis]|uniref:FecR family protein n=1 Tax=Prosthecobacter fusiformis TaxID=48464 RepID=A0A4R7S124_9BACT|nr:FecR domain-containing protein [Prosthecobacter fusiformis]TDU71379.1 FecR family protein [Prosthecobacter fusiformis]